MGALEQTVEIEGTIDSNHHLVLDNENLPIDGPVRVKVLIQPAERKGEALSLKKLRGIMKNSTLDGLEFQKEVRSDWENR